MAQIGRAIEGLVVMEDWHNFGADYEKTLMASLARFEATCPDLADNYDQRFYRIWRYYLSVFAASFRARQISLWQVMLSPHGGARWLCQRALRIHVKHLSTDLCTAQPGALRLAGAARAD